MRVKNEKIFDILVEETGGTWVLPEIGKYNKDVGAFIKDELIDIKMQDLLNNSQAINWWVEDIPGKQY